MNVQMKAYQQLEQAALLITRAMAQLDMSGAPCCTCGKSTWRNGLHAKVHESVSGMPDRLMRVAAELRGNDPARSVPTKGYEDSIAHFHAQAVADKGGR